MPCNTCLRIRKAFAKIMPKRVRDYKKEYANYHGKPEKVAERSNRNKATRKLGREGKGDGKEVDHIDGNPKNNARSNLRVVSRTTNRKKGG